ncbi:type II toxin-antitoxin system PemK/MazF family toxin [Brevibacillus ruminantium]|uniref:Type II toxin-antitoxin system PemK/MazF family toxin n=1 Tax=Brevibacillus ruminantium TaxID=2950604 RepID=A0ABY4WDF4_9BACL|nr:type II toxin-antitoxin system PemK/MazF family toxin [Brevibacillus ruminantium]USG65088.1 type II toxin-antitoxin system PemK/MazF family toxin [Brevibacillus ruminantium]
MQGSQEEDIEKIWSEVKEFLTTQPDREKTVKFVKWMKQKAVLAFGSENVHKFPIFRKGIYWAELGENIGSEENKHRPVVLLWSTKEAPIAVVVPLTTQRLHDEYFFHIDLEHYNNTALIEQIRTISLRRITYPLRAKGRVASVSHQDIMKIDDAIRRLFTTRHTAT